MLRKNQWENVLSSPFKRLDLNVFIGFDDVDFIHCSIPLNLVALGSVISPLLSFLLHPRFIGSAFLFWLSSFPCLLYHHTHLKKGSCPLFLKSSQCCGLERAHNIVRKHITSFLRIKASSWSFYNTSHSRMRNRQLFN